MNIYILVEITKRELESNLLLAMIAAMQGNQVLISNMSTFEYLSKKKMLNKGIFHTKSIVHDDRKQNLHKNFEKNGIKITSIDEENGLIKKDLDNFCKVRFSEEALKYVDKVFCWGDHDFSSLSKMYPKQKNKFSKTGAPRCDLWKKKFKEYWYQNNQSKKIHSKQVLISLNFSLVNGFESFEKKIKKLKKSKYFERSADFEKEIFLIAEQNKTNFYHFKDLINYLSKECPDIVFLVRPHPREKKTTWQNILDKRDNILISNKGNFNEALSSSDILIQNGCTTAFQAALYNVPIISYVVNEKLSSHGRVANKLGVELNNKIKVKELIDKHFAGKKIINPKDDEILDNKLFIDDELSCFKIFEEWKKIGNNIEFNRNNWEKIKFYLLMNNFKNFFKKDNKFENINIQEIKLKISKLKKILNFKEQPQTIKISNKAILIK